MDTEWMKLEGRLRSLFVQIFYFRNERKQQGECSYHYIFTHWTSKIKANDAKSEEYYAFNKVRLILRWDMLQFGCCSELHEDTLIHGKLSQFACIFKI